MRCRFLLAWAVVFAAHYAAKAQATCQYPPIITALDPTSARIYPPQYTTSTGTPITCTPSAPCTLTDMTFADITFTQGTRVYVFDEAGTNFCPYAGFEGAGTPIWFVWNSNCTYFYTGEAGAAGGLWYFPLQVGLGGRMFR